MSEYELYKRILEDGRVITVQKMSFNKGKVHVATHEGSMFYEDGW